MAIGGSIVAARNAGGGMVMPLSDWLDVPKLVSSALGATAFGWLGAYVAVRGKFFASRKEVDTLRQDLQANTELTRSIEQKFSRSDILWRDQLSFRQQQLELFYGPVYGYLKSQRDIYDMWMSGMLSEKNLEVKKLFAEQNAIIRQLIIDKAHLIEGSEMPEDFVRFFSSTIIFDLYASGTEEGMVPCDVAKDIRTAYPDGFETHVICVTKQLKDRIAALHAQYAPPLESQIE
jgi:hypothetical protein